MRAPPVASGLTIVIIVGACVLGFIVIGLIGKLVLKGIKGPLMKRVTEKYGPGVLRVDYGANSFGLESLGRAQLRGNGALALAPEELTFFQFMPERDFVVPLRSIGETSLVRSHLGKATVFPLVKIQFDNEGKADSIAIFVKDAADWKQAIDERRAAS